MFDKNYLRIKLLGKEDMRKLSVHSRLRVGYELLELATNDVFLDIGCAWGYLEKKLIDIGMKKVYAIDVRTEAIRKANKDVPGAHFALGSATNLSFKDEIFDKVSLFDVIEHIRVGGEMSALSEANRVLKQGGILVVSVPNKGILNICQYTDMEYLFQGHRHYTKEELTRLLKKCNFDVVSVFTSGSMIFILMLYIRLFFRGFNNLVHNTKIYNKIISFLDNFEEDSVYKDNRKNGYTLYIKAKKI